MNIIQLTIKNSEEIIAETIKVLKSGGLVIFPSDTVYGALVDATSRAAVEKLIAFKNRPPGKPISIFVPGFKSIFLQAKAALIDQAIKGRPPKGRIFLSLTDLLPLLAGMTARII